MSRPTSGVAFQRAICATTFATVPSPSIIAYTRSGSRSSDARRRYTSSTSGVTPASCAAVMPSPTSASIPRRSASSISAGDGAGIRLSTSSIAASTSTPVGRPPASRTILPPGGSFVSGPMPAAASAEPFAHPAWPSTRTRKTGWSGTARESVASEGNACRGQRF